MKHIAVCSLIDLRIVFVISFVLMALIEMPEDRRRQCGRTSLKKRAAGGHECADSGTNAAAVTWLVMVFVAFSVVVKSAAAQGTTFSFVQFSNNGNHKDLSLLGDASVAQEDLALDLTQKSSGRALYRAPIQFIDTNSQASFSFQTSFIFSIEVAADDDADDLSSSSSSSSSSMGEGLAFVIAPDNTTLGSSGPWLGLLSPLNDTSTATPDSRAHTVAVEFDIHKDIEFWDIDNNHIGVDINSLNSVVAKAASSDSQLVNLTSGHIKAWVEYDGEARKMNVSITPFATTSDYPKPAEPLLVVDIDLSAYVNQYMFVGFSAATGSGVVNHKVHTWSFQSTGSSISDFENVNPGSPGSPTSSGSSTQRHSPASCTLGITHGCYPRLLAVLLVLLVSCSFKELASLGH